MEKITTLLTGQNYLYFIAAALLWTIPWKGMALWRSARNGQLLWFVILLIVNTLAILEIIYLIFFSKKRYR